MKEKPKWTRIIYIIGIIALIIGLVDPLEGSIVIAGGSILLALSTFVTRDRHRKIFLLSMILIVNGVGSLFYLSSLGGFGDEAEISWWWRVIILPYPLGWLTAVILLIVRAIKGLKTK